MDTKEEVIKNIDKQELKSVIAIAISIARNTHVRNNLAFIKSKLDLIRVRVYDLNSDIDQDIQSNFTDIYNKLEYLEGPTSCFKLDTSSICVACSNKGTNMNAYPYNIVTQGFLSVPLGNRPCIIATEKELNDFCSNYNYDINTVPAQIIAEDFIKFVLNSN